ncbi:MAG: hypothetical protein H7318_17710 [Oligoflexus sp.]|nr:hypothetical protein [Oligoflexus sp.]
MGVKNTSIGQLLSLGALALAGHQAYRYLNNKGQKKQAFREQDSKSDLIQAEAFPASDPAQLSRGSASAIH